MGKTLKTSLAVVLALAATFALYLVLRSGPEISAFLKTLASLDWKPPLLIGFLGLYFIFAIQLWSDITSSWRQNRDQYSIVGIFLRAIFLPAVMVFTAIGTALYAVLYFLLLRFFHEQLRAIADRAIAVFMLVWIFVYSTLLFANLWPHKLDRCLWQFPKILSCVLTNYQDLAAGVIGAGFTIFAGWLAWLAVQQQIAHRSEGPHTQEAPSAPSLMRPANDRSIGQRAVAKATKPVWGAAILIGLALYFASGVLFLGYETILSLFSSTESETEVDGFDIAGIAVCAPLRDARIVFRDQRGVIVEQRTIEAPNETVVAIRNGTDVPRLNGVLSIKPIGFTKLDPELLSSEVKGSSSISPQSIKVSRSANLVTVTFDRLAPRETIFVTNIFAMPVGYIVGLRADGEPTETKHVGPGCNYKINSKESAETKLLFEYRSSLCAKGSDNEISCRLISDKRNRVGTTREELILTD